ncbi:MAG: FeoB-associated Cys-rich membrane protein [Clostridiales bacterium]|nr:FeoB-associated Cys-rich membrane protein [Clostridiales bacterium]
MKAIDLIIIAVIALIIGLVAWFIRREKKKGVKCIGCPDAGKCAGICSGCPGNCMQCDVEDKKA